MSLGIREKLALQKHASEIKKQLKESPSFKEKLALQKSWALIIKQLKGNDHAKKPEDETLATDDNGKVIDVEVNKAATSNNNELNEPSDAQKEAGNYKKGRIKLFGLDIVIENPKGSVRSGQSADGTIWSTTMYHHYGDIKGSKGADGDAVDVFIGDNTLSEQVFIIDQIRPETRQFDEHKVMLGFDNLRDAKMAYLKNYNEGWQGLGAIKEMSVDAFQSWVYAGEKKSPVKYVNGQFNHQEKPIESINVKLYEKLDSLTVKQEVIKLHENGSPLSDVIKVLDHWLSVNLPSAEAA